MNYLEDIADVFTNIVEVADEHPVATAAVGALFCGVSAGFGAGYYKGRQDADTQHKYNESFDNR